MCQLVEISRGSFYAWEAGAAARAARQAADEELAERLRAVHAAEPGNRAYGAPRVTAELNDGAEPAGRGPEGGVRMDHPLQHPPPALRLRTDQPEQLRGPPGPGYA